MESVTVEAKKIIEIGNKKVIHRYDINIPIGNLNTNCLSPHILDYLVKFAHDLISDDVYGVTQNKNEEE